MGQPQQSSTGTQGFGLQLGVSQSKAPTSTLAPLTINTGLLSQPARSAAVATASGIGNTGLQTIGKPPPAYTAPSSSASIPATSTAGGVPTGKKYTYKQLEKMINEVSVCVCTCTSMLIVCVCVCCVCVCCVCVCVCTCLYVRGRLLFVMIIQIEYFECK